MVEWKLGNMRKPRIIIFDDDTMILELLNDYFSRMNFEVQCFSQPILCPPCENTNPCADIIITDFQMPRINGFELLNHQNQQGCTINIKNKAIVSGVLPEEHKDKVSELAGAFFEKPFALQEIAAWTKECIRRVNLSQPLCNYYVYGSSIYCTDAYRNRSKISNQNDRRVKIQKII